MKGTGGELEQRAASVANRLAREIKRLRTAAGLSQRVLATRIGYSRQYVSMAEWGDANIPSLDLVTAIDTALGAGGTLVALRGEAKADRSLFESQTVSVGRQLEEPIDTLVRSSRITEGTIAGFTAVTRLLAGQRQSIAPEALVGVIAAHRDSVAELFRVADEDSAKRQLGALLGETSIVASRLWSAVGDRPMALANCVYARQLGDKLGDPLLSAIARIFESNLRSDAATLIGTDGDIVVGLRMLREAAAFGDVLPAAARARIAAEQAQIYAVLELPRECRDALVAAYRAVEEIDEVDRTGLFSDWNPARLRVYEGTCWLFLHEPRRAIAALEAAVRATGPGDRNVGLAAQVDLASAYVLDGELVEGCRLIGETYESLAAMGNQRGIERARCAVERLAPWKAEQPVRELVQRISASADQ